MLFLFVYDALYHREFDVTENARSSCQPSPTLCGRRAPRENRIGRAVLLLMYAGAARARGRMYSGPTSWRYASGISGGPIAIPHIFFVVFLCLSVFRPLFLSHKHSLFHSRHFGLCGSTVVCKGSPGSRGGVPGLASSWQSHHASSAFSLRNSTLRCS